MKQQLRRRAIRGWTGAGLVVLLVGAAGPASATQVSETWQDAWDETFVDVCGAGTADTADDVTVETHVAGTADFVLRERGTSGLYYLTVETHEASTYTNLDTDIAWTGDFRTHEKDLSVTADADGVLTIRVGVSYHFTVYDPEGRPGGVSNGRNEFVVVYDPATDTELSFTFTKNVGGRTTSDFCEDAIRFTT